VSDTDGIGNILQASGTTAAASSAASAPAGAAPRPRTSSLSPSFAAVAGDATSVTLAGGLISRASQGSDVRFEKVVALREAIEAGTYRVSASALANSLLLAMIE